MNSSPSWHKHAIFYAIEVATFCDANYDGIGDFVGITKKLDYLKELGVSCIWLLPFYPSGQRDNGYDVTDYCSVDPNYGMLSELKDLIKEAHKKGIRIIIDLVVHHTSNLHPWFQKARENHRSDYRDYYIWQKEIPKGDFPEDRPAFPDVDSSVWTYDGVAKEFYYHRFYRFQPDLNIKNPLVQEEIFSIIEFWLKLGIDGFRVDAAPLLFDRKGGIEETTFENPGQFLENMHAFIRKINPEAVLLAEVDISEKKTDQFFSEQGRMDLIYNFLLNRYVFLSLARGEAYSIKEELARLPVPPRNAQWVNFLRNLDELNISRLSQIEKENIYTAFGPNPEDQIYNRGIRKRLATMFNGDMRRIKMAYSLLFSLPGATLLMYGDEIGMGDNLKIPEREAVRIPMQWEDSINAGFSRLPEKALFRSALSDGHFGYRKVNVRSAIEDKNSLFYHMKKLCQIQIHHTEIGEGGYSIIANTPSAVFAISYHSPKGKLIILHNLSDQPQVVQLPELYKIDYDEILNDGMYAGKEGLTINLNGYGFRWLVVKG